MPDIWILYVVLNQNPSIHSSQRWTCQRWTYTRVLGKCWMDALELALHCSGLMRPLPRSDLQDSGSAETSVDLASALGRSDASLRSHARMDETECERHFDLCGMCLYYYYYYTPNTIITKVGIIV